MTATPPGGTPGTGSPDPSREANLNGHVNEFSLLEPEPAE